MASYLTSSDSDFSTLAASCPELEDAFLADSKLDAWLLRASERIDTGHRYQGRKYDPTQEREFPRIARGQLLEGAIIVPAPIDLLQLIGTAYVAQSEIWDFDLDNQAIIVPDRVKRACLYEARSLWKGSRGERMDAIHDGLAAQSIGSGSESYKPNTAAGAALCREACELMDFYRLRSGQMI